MQKNRFTLLAVSIACLVATPISTIGCETCAVYTPTDLNMPTAEDTQTEQRFKLNGFTRYSKLETRLDGDHESSNLGEEIESWIYQLSLQGKIHKKLTLHINLPIISRDFTRKSEDGLVKDSESGLGDVTLLAKYTVFQRDTDEGSFKGVLIGGLKTPTGEPDRINEEHGHEMQEGEHHEGEAKHEHAEENHEEESAISGHDIALGSGSWDFIAGLRLQGQCGSWFSNIALLHYFRQRGDFKYEFSDDTYASVHIGRFVFADEKQSLSLRCGILGEFRDADKQSSVKIEHTNLDAWYADATAIYSYKQVVTELGIDLPIDQHVTAATLVPDYRLRFSAGVQF